MFAVVVLVSSVSSFWGSLHKLEEHRKRGSISLDSPSATEALVSDSFESDILDDVDTEERIKFIKDNFGEEKYRKLLDHYDEEQDREELAENSGKTYGAYRTSIHRLITDVKKLVEKERPNDNDD